MIMINNELFNLVIYDYIWLLYMVVFFVDFCFLICMNMYVMKWSENGMLFSVKYDCNWLDFDKVLFKLVLKNLVGFKLKIKIVF